MAEIKTLLDDVIETELANLRTLPSGNEERAKAIRDLAALHKLRIEEIRAQADVDEKSERREMDGRQRREELACKDADRAREEDRPVCAHCGGRRGTGVAADVLRHLDETGIQV